MRALVFLLLCNASVFGLFDLFNTAWFPSWKKINNNFKSDVSETGRVFVTMFGYPAKCEYKGISHSCTLSLACWLIGGSSQAGCGANPWIIACCVTSKTKKGHTHHNTRYYVKPEDPNSHERDNIIHVSEEKEDLVRSPIMQRKAEEIDDECGLSIDRVISKRIIGGNEARFGQFPWQAHLRIAAYQCGGVLVSRRFVATAAHCIIRARLKDITVYLGELDTQDTGKVVELAPAELHRVKRKVLHPKFQFKTTQPDRYDLALLELVTVAGYSYHIVPICLPESDINLAGRNGVVAGWGKIIPSTELMGTNVLRSATVPILDTKECMSWHKTKQIVVDLHEEMLCAGHEDGHQDACLGDSGGPLIVLENGRWTLVGITSAGFGCGEPHQPGIYHSIPVTTKWIKSIIRRHL